MERRHTTHGQYLSNESVSDLNELHGWFQYSDAQSDTSRAFANNAIHKFIESAKEAEIVRDATGLSPREMAEQRDELERALRQMVEFFSPYAHGSEYTRAEALQDAHDILEKCK